MAETEGRPQGAVVMVTPRWRRDGGVATHVIASAAALAAAGVEVHVVARVVDRDEPAAGVHVHESPHLLDTGVPAEERLAGMLTAAPAAVHLHQFEDPEVAIAVRRHAPLVLSMHGYSACTSGVHYFRPGQECGRPHGPGCWPNLLGRGCAHTRNPTSLPAAYRDATRAVRVLREADLGVSHARVIDRHLAANGVACRAIVPLFATLEPVRAEGHEDRRRVVFAGRVVRAKGLSVLLRAMALVGGSSSSVATVPNGPAWSLWPLVSASQRVSASAAGSRRASWRASWPRPRWWRCRRCGPSRSA